MTHHYSKVTIFITILIGFLLSAKFLTFDVSVTAPNLSGLCVGGTYQNLGDIVITEVNDNDFTATTNGNFLRLQIVGNFQFEPGVGTVSVTSGGGDDLSNASITVSTNQVIIFYDAGPGPSNQNDVMTISGLRVRAITAAGAGSLQMTGGATITGITPNSTNLATFSSIASPNVTLVDNDADNIICAGNSVTFTAGGASTYQFFINGVLQTAGGGNTFSGGSNEIFTTTNLTNGDIVTVIGSNGGCTTSINSASFTVNPTPYVGLSSSDIDNTLCVGQSITFTATSNGTTFTFRRGVTVVQTGASNTYTINNVTAGDAGNYTVEAFLGGCSTTSNIIALTINPLPVVGFVPPPDTDFDASYNSPVNLTNGLTFGGTLNGTVLAGNQGTYSGPGVINGRFYPSVAGPGNHIITFTYTNGNGCTNTATIVMRVSSNTYLNNFPVTGSFCKDSGLQPSATNLTPASISFNYLTGKNCTLSPSGTITMQSHRFSIGQIATNSVVLQSGNAYKVNVNVYSSVIYTTDWVQINGNYNCTGDCADYGFTNGLQFRTWYQYFSISPTPVLTYTGFNDGANVCASSNITISNFNNGVPMSASSVTYQVSDVSAVAGFANAPNNVIDGATGDINLTDSYFSSTTFKDVWIRTTTTINGCSGTSAAKRLRVYPIPTPSFSGLNTFYCQGDAVSALTLNSGLGETFFPSRGGFIVKNTTTNAVVGYVNANGSGNYIMNMNSLSPGNYSVTAYYYSSNLCYAESVPDTPSEFFEIRQAPAVDFDNLDTEYCANEGNSLLQGKDGITPVFTGTFQVRRTYPSITPLELLPTNRFSPQKPLPNEVTPVPLGDNIYEIVYTYTNASGCIGTSTKTTIVRELPIPSFTFPASNETGVTTGAVCRDANSIILTPAVTSNDGTFIPANGRFLIERIQPLPTAPLTNPFTMAFGLNTIDFGSSQFSIPTNTNDLYVYEISYIYTDSKGCSDTSAIKTLTVNPSPTVTPSDITITNRCLGDVTQFTVNYSRPISSYEWAGTEIPTLPSTLTTSNTFSITYTSTGVKNIDLTITNPEGCKQTISFSIVIKAKPQPNFTFLGQCLGSPTQFTDQTQIVGNGDPIVAWAWDFGDGNTSTQPSPQHIYNSAGVYNVSLTVQTSTNSDLSCPVTISKQVVIFGQYAPTTTNPYIESFNSNDGGWRTGQTTATPSSWQWGNQTTTLNKIRPKDGAFWRTFRGATALDTVQYRSNEQSFIESPCFDLTNLERPSINFDYWVDTRFGQDGVALIYSINDGVTWVPLGNVNQGVEWYNAAGITSLPGSSSPGLPNGSINGWAGNTQTEWKTARFVLDNIKNLAGIGGKVRFRIVFGSLPIGPGSYDGFAVDNIQISSRNRKILLEHFTNAGAPDVGSEDSFINNIANTQAESIDIRYHAAFPNPEDPFNADNTADPSARALFYGVSQIPRTSRDGETFSNKYSVIDPLLVEYQKRSLKPSPFEINIAFGNTPVELLNVGATIRSVEDFNKPIIVRMAVIEKQIDGNVVGLAGNTFRNVVKRLLPDAAGTRVNTTWIKNVTQTTVNQSYNPTEFYNKNQMAVVVFIQDEITKEIYQAAYAEPTTIPGGITAVEDALNDQIYIYPNPAKDKVYIKTQNLGKLSYQVYDGLGKIIEEGNLNEETYELNIQKYASGLYMIRLIDSNGNMGNKKLIINK